MHGSSLPGVAARGRGLSAWAQGLQQGVRTSVADGVFTGKEREQGRCCCVRDASHVTVRVGTSMLARRDGCVGKGANEPGH